MDLKKQVGQTSITKLSELVATAIVNVENSVSTLDSKVDALTASDIAFSNNSFVATDVADALAELLTKASNDEITVEAGTNLANNILSETLIKKGGVTIGTISIPKDYVNNIIGLVAEDGSGNPGTFLKVNTAAKSEDTPVYQYVDVSGLIEYVTSGSQSGDMIVVSINSNHEVTATITDGTVTKAKLASGVQASLDLADSAYQLPSTGMPKTDLAAAVQASLDLADSAIQDISGKADKVGSATNGNFAGLDANGNLTDSGSKAADFATAAQGAKADTAVQPADIDEISDATVTAIWNAALTAARTPAQEEPGAGE